MWDFIVNYDKKNFVFKTENEIQKCYAVYALIIWNYIYACLK